MSERLLKEAAKRWKRQENYLDQGGIEQEADDTRALADFAAALLDETAIDESLLRRLGFVFPDDHAPRSKPWPVEPHCYAPLRPGSATSRLHFGCPKGKPPFAYAGSINLPEVKTLGQLRALCFGLGITLQETERE